MEKGLSGVLNDIKGNNSLAFSSSFVIHHPVASMMSRPFRAQSVFCLYSQGVALGWYVAAFQA
jgi:hypothetical protein